MSLEKVTSSGQALRGNLSVSWTRLFSLGMKRYNANSVARKKSTDASSRRGILGVSAALLSLRDGSADSCTVSSVLTENIHVTQESRG